MTFAEKSIFWMAGIANFHCRPAQAIRGLERRLAFSSAVGGIRALVGVAMTVAYTWSCTRLAAGHHLPSWFRGQIVAGVKFAAGGGVLHWCSPEIGPGSPVCLDILYAVLDIFVTPALCDRVPVSRDNLKSPNRSIVRSQFNLPYTVAVKPL